MLEKIRTVGGARFSGGGAYQSFHHGFVEGACLGR